MKSLLPMPGAAASGVTGNRDYGLRVKAEYVCRLDGSSDFSGATAGAEALNGRRYVFVSGLLTDAQSLTWRNLNAPYFTGYDYPFGSIIYGTDSWKLTIEPGTRHVFGPESSNFMTDGASFTANGTAEEPINFTGEEPFLGYWKACSSSPPNRSNCTMSNSAGVAMAMSSIWEQATSSSGAKACLGGAELHEVTFEGSSSCGLNISSSLLEQVNGTDRNFSANAKHLCVDGVEQSMGD